MEFEIRKIDELKRMIKEGLAEEISLESPFQCSRDTVCLERIQDRAKSLKANLIGIPDNVDSEYLFARSSAYQALLDTQ